MSDLQFGDKVEIKEGKFKGSIGIVKKIFTTTNVQVDFIGGRKTVPLENIEPSDEQATRLLAKPELIEAEFDEVE